MTLEQVMALDGRELDQAVAMKVSPVKCVQEWLYFEPAESDGVIYNGPDFSQSWAAAMRIRDWARGLEYRKQTQFVSGLVHVTERRRNISGERLSMWACLLLSECPDYCRAALLVGE